ncbi:unnamed protein product [Symbiodinium pilosum]|uniref:Uncharacterized protein n=1 Tax=Symbiodinium pilosum TaxID=2952 RepID=A0A812YHF1_SYMPI|nr:unnamed protein product [Symbiodinium pilosum]
MATLQTEKLRSWAVLQMLLSGSVLCTAFGQRRLSDSTECSAPCQPSQFKALPLVALCGGGGCTVEDDILKGKSRLFMQLPVNSSGIRVEMTTRQTDQDLQLVDPTTGTCVAGAVGDTCSDGGRPANAGTGCTDETDYCIAYEGMNWYFTGDKQLAPVLEKLALEGSVTQLLSVWVEAPSGGALQVQVRNDPILPCPDQLPGCVPCEQYDRCGEFDKKICDGSAVVLCEATTLTTTTGTTTSVTITSSTSTSKTSSTTLSSTVTTKTATTTSTTATRTSTATTTISSTSYTATTSRTATLTSTTASTSTTGSSKTSTQTFTASTTTTISLTVTSTVVSSTSTSSTTSAETSTRTSRTTSSFTISTSVTTSQTETRTFTETTTSTTRTRTTSSSRTSSSTVSATTTVTGTATSTSETSTSQTSTWTTSASTTSTSRTATSTTTKSMTSTETGTTSTVTMTATTSMSTTVTSSTSATTSSSLTSFTMTTTLTSTLTTSKTETQTTVTTTSSTVSTTSVTTSISSTTVTTTTVTTTTETTTTMTSTTSSTTETCGCCASCGMGALPPALSVADDDGAVALSVAVPVVLVLILLVVLLAGWLCHRKKHQEVHLFPYPVAEPPADPPKIPQRDARVGTDEDCRDLQELRELKLQNQSLVVEISDLRHQLSVAKQAAAEPAALLESQRAKQEVLTASWSRRQVRLQAKITHLQTILQHMIYHATELARAVQGDCANQGKLHQQVAVVMQRIRTLQEELSSPPQPDASTAADSPCSPSQGYQTTLQPSPPHSTMQEPVTIQEPVALDHEPSTCRSAADKPPPETARPVAQEVAGAAGASASSAPAPFKVAFRSRASASANAAVSSEFEPAFEASPADTRLAAAAAYVQDHGVPFLPLLPSHVGQYPERSRLGAADPVRENQQDLRSLRDRLLRRHNMSPHRWNDRFRTMSQRTAERGFRADGAQQVLERRMRQASLE